jgi:hypothetical protein
MALLPGLFSRNGSEISIGALSLSQLKSHKKNVPNKSQFSFSKRNLLRVHTGN